MASSLQTRLQRLGPVIGRAALALLLTLFIYGLLWLVRWLFFPRQFPLDSLLGFVVLWALSYLAVTAVAWARKRLLWSLRNQMAAAYVFIAVVPVLLLLTMAGLGAYLLYWQLGSYVMYTEMQTRVQRVATVAGGVATTLAIESTSTGRPASELPVPEQTQGFLQAAKADIPGLTVEVGAGQDLLERTGSDAASGFKGIVFSNGALAVRAVAVREAQGGKVMVSAWAPITPEFLETLAPELGPVRFLVMRPATGHSVPGTVVTLNGERVAPVDRISSEHRAEPRAANLFDKRIVGVTTLDLVDVGDGGAAKGTALYAAFVTRPSVLNRRLFGPLGYHGSSAVTLLLMVGAIFLVLEIAALATGIVLTRSITTAADNLYLATQHVQSGDLSFRVSVQRQDELGSLGKSFNSMMQSIAASIADQRERQRLESELAIAREVQNELFPRALPNVPGVQLEAICRPARLVSGDYYDFIRVGPTRLAMVLADISGKGISAALLMASLQGALRSEFFRDEYRSPDMQPVPNTAKVVAHLNRHLFLNTSEERYATLFLAVYDVSAHQLTYTNAGHIPPLFAAGHDIQRLETDDTVIGLFGDVQFRQNTVEVPPEALLVVFSDGMTEPENERGEAFGAERLEALALRLRDESPHAIVQAMLNAAEQWHGSAEQADDMTVIVARLATQDRNSDNGSSTDQQVNAVQQDHG